jgi:hypothetical protein
MSKKMPKAPLSPTAAERIGQLSQMSREEQQTDWHEHLCVVPRCDTGCPNLPAVPPEGTGRDHDALIVLVTNLKGGEHEGSQQEKLERACLKTYLLGNHGKAARRGCKME